MRVCGDECWRALIFIRGRSGIRPDREGFVWRVEERVSLVKSTQKLICRTAVRTRSLIQVTDHGHDA